MATFKWTVEFEVDEMWVEDGFSMTGARALEMLASDLEYADMSAEIFAKVIKSPSRDRILKCQGYDIKKMTDKEKNAELGLD